MAGWKPLKRLLGSVAIVGLIVVIGISCCTDGQGRQGAPEPPPQAARQEKLDLDKKALDRIPVGTVIGQEPPRGWSNLVLFAVPTLTPQDERDAPPVASRFAKMFKFTILANVARADEKSPYYLERLGRGFATTVGGKQTIISGKNTLGANLGVFGPRILAENEKILDNDVRQVVRTATMLIFDAQAVMLRGNAHVDMVMRHAILVDPESGKLYTLVWLLNRDYQPAEKAIQMLPDGMREKRYLSVKRDKFGPLGVPDRDAFAIRQVPQGKAIAYTDDLQKAASVKTFDEDEVPKIEKTLRAAANKASAD
jgi:hypothetical protein